MEGRKDTARGIPCSDLRLGQRAQVLGQPNGPELSKIPPQVPRPVRGGCGGKLPGGSGKRLPDSRASQRAGQEPLKAQPAGRRSPAFVPGGQPKAVRPGCPYRDPGGYPGLQRVVGRHCAGAISQGSTSRNRTPETASLEHAAGSRRLWLQWSVTQGLLTAPR